ncbi:MAG: divalent-cation tolerance protein CutA [Candidatus Omnitrophota bacterium]
MKEIIIFVTCKDKKEAGKIAAFLVEKKIAACVNIIPQIESVFRWEGKVEKSKEALLLIKSRADKLPRIFRMVKSLHSYEVPEIIALPIQAGEKRYMEWLNASVRDPL